MCYLTRDFQQLRTKTTEGNMFYQTLYMIEWSLVSDRPLSKACLSREGICDGGNVRRAGVCVLWSRW